MTARRSSTDPASTDPASTDLPALIIAEARRWIGTPYRHQQSTRGIGCDCLGLVRGVWREIHGIEPETPPPYSADWSDIACDEAMLKAASRHLQRRPDDVFFPGDVLVFRWRPHLPAKHCAIATAPDRMVHAYQAAGFVAEGALVPAWRRRIAGVFVFPASFSLTAERSLHSLASAGARDDARSAVADWAGEAGQPETVPGLAGVARGPHSAIGRKPDRASAGQAALPEGQPPEAAMRPARHE